MDDGHPRESTETVLDGFRALVPETWTVTHARGADIEVLVPADEELWPDGQPAPDVFSAAPPDEAMIAEAVRAATQADLAVCVLGDTIALTGEYCSTATLELQGGQIALLDALVETGTPVVLVLVHSKPSVLPPSAERAAAIVEAFNPGMRGGRAIAELVLGLIEPTGRLPLTVPRHVGQQPVYYNQIRGQHGDRYADLTQDPLFAFGEGLSYTSVEYADLVVAQERVAVDGTVRASVTLTNTGLRPALETVQVYVSDLVTSATWAEKELKAFRQVRRRARREHARRPRARCRRLLDRHRRRGPSGRARALRPARRPELTSCRPAPRGVHRHRLNAALTWSAGQPVSPARDAPPRRARSVIADRSPSVTRSVGSPGSTSPTTHRVR